jgi:hypothetical protein
MLRLLDEKDRHHISIGKPGSLIIVLLQGHKRIDDCGHGNLM